MTGNFVLYVIYIFIFLSFLKPAGFDHMGLSSVNTFFNISRILCAIIICVLYLKQRRRNKLIKYLFIYFSFCCFSTYIGIGDFNRILIFAGSIVAFAMIFEIVKEKRFKVIITSLLFVYMVFIVVAFFFLYQAVGFTINIEKHFTSEQLMYAYFLSSSNGSASFFIPAMVLSILNLYISGKNNLLSWITIVFTYCSGLIIWSATSLVAETVLLLYAVFVRFNLDDVFRRRVKSKLLIIVCLTISIGITFFKIQDLFEFIIVDILKKDLTMTGRTEVWNNGFNAFVKSPILGMGNYNDVVRTCDNCYAQLLGDSGILGVAFFIALMIFSYRKLKQSQNRQVCYLFTVVYALLLLMFVAESWCQFFGMYVLLILFSKADYIQHYIDKNNVKYL